MSNRFTRRSVNLDDASHNRCKELAEDMAISVSGLLRLIIRNDDRRRPNLMSSPV
jgi:hypothetical protein